MEQKFKFACVQCGQSVDNLYKKYSASVLKLTQCINCSNVADKYIEYDNVIILIDLVLISRQAYRHVLFNTEFKNHWKLAVLILLLKTYDEWVTVHSPQGLFAIEHTFYASFVVTLAGAAVYTLPIFAFVHVYSVCMRISANFILLWKAIVLSNFGQFLLLTSLIWADAPKDVHLGLVALYTTISQMQALSVVCPVTRSMFLLPLMLGFTAQSAMTRLARQWIS